MKNKDKYDLKKITTSISHQINGCGKKIDESRVIKIIYQNKLVAKIKDKDRPLLNLIFEWLESEE